MTKHVRIENADTNLSVGLKVEVYNWVRNGDHDAPYDGEWVLETTKLLPYPTRMEEFLVHDSRQIRVSEYKIPAA